jgi:hypothetical protein
MSSFAASSAAVGASAPAPAIRALAPDSAQHFFRAAKRGRDHEDIHTKFENLNSNLTFARNVLRDSLTQVSRIASETPECPIEIDFVLRRHIAPLIVCAERSEQQIRNILTILGEPDMVKAFVANTRGIPHRLVRENLIPMNHASILENLNSSLAKIREHEERLTRRLDAISDACRTD